MATPFRRSIRLRAQALKADRRLSCETLEDRRLLAAQITNVGLAAELVDSDAGVVGWLVPESQQGVTDLNSDADATDRVAHAFDTATGVTTNLGLAASQRRVGNGFVSLFVREADQGNSDLNGDADTVDNVLHVYDSASGTTTNIGLASNNSIFGNGFIAFDVIESDQAGADLNGDGDSTDAVLHVLDVTSGTVTNLGLDSLQDRANGDLIAMRVNESRQGADLNGDGDTSDFVLHVYDHSTGSTTNFGFATNAFEVVGSTVVFEVDESAQGATDLNGDGDTSDRVAFSLDVSSGSTTKSGCRGGSSGDGSDGTTGRAVG